MGLLYLTNTNSMFVPNDCKSSLYLSVFVSCDYLVFVRELMRPSSWRKPSSSGATSARLTIFQSFTLSPSLVFKI